MCKLDRKGKGIILLHDFQQATAKAVADLLNELKANGYKVVHMKGKAPMTALAQWDDAAKSNVKNARVSAPTVPHQAWCEPLWTIRLNPAWPDDRAADDRCCLAQIAL